MSGVLGTTPRLHCQVEIADLWISAMLHPALPDDCVSCRPDAAHRIHYPPPRLAVEGTKRATLTA